MVPKYFREHALEFNDTGKRAVQIAIVRNEDAQAYVKWSEARIAELEKVLAKAKEAEVSAGFRGYHIGQIDSAHAHSLARDHTLQPLELIVDGKPAPNPRHPYNQGRELVIWLRKTGALDDECGP